MASGAEAPRRTWLDLLLVLGTVWMLALVVRASLQSADVEADIAVVSRDAKLLCEAFARFHDQNGVYPGIGGESFLDRDSLNPLRERGYYEGAVAARLSEGRVDAYVATDGRGANDEFWLEMSLKTDPTVRFLVARSDDAPLGGGRWREGAFIYRDGVLEPL
jgi:hypothetical protein